MNVYTCAHCGKPTHDHCHRCVLEDHGELALCYDCLQAHVAAAHKPLRTITLRIMEKGGHILDMGDHTADGLCDDEALGVVAAALYTHTTHRYMRTRERERSIHAKYTMDAVARALGVGQTAEDVLCGDAEAPNA